MWTTRLRRRRRRRDVGRPLTARLAAGVIVARGDAVLIVCPTYKDHWDVPGGMVEQGEAPLAACRREIREELGLDAGPLSCASVDWAPKDGQDRMLLLFDAPALAEVDVAGLRFPDGELSEARFVPITDLDGYTTPHLTRRLTSTFHALRAGTVPVYLEHGLPV